MSCAHCEDLRIENEYLRAELGRIPDERSKLRALGMTPAEASILAALYAAKGRVVNRFVLFDNLPNENDFRSPQIISVYVSRIRSAIGKGCIRCVWGDGYGLTPAGMEFVSAAIGRNA